MTFFDGIVVPVPRANRDAALEFSREVNGQWLALGALRVVRAWGVDVPEGQHTDFRRAVAAKDDEDIIFGFVEWPDRATRDAAIAKARSGGGDAPRPTPPFDATRLIFGGFETTYDTQDEVSK